MDYTIGYFGDERLKKNGALIFQRLLERRNVSLRKLGGNRATEVKLGRFLSNKRVTVEEIINEAVGKTSELVSNLHVLAIQDTTEINYQAHLHKVNDLGPVGNGTDIGLFLHPLLVLEAESGACLGLGGAHIWTRNILSEGKKTLKKKSYDYQKLPIEEKESYRWLETASKGKESLKTAKLITIIADRESDIYEEWYRIPDEKTHLLTRASYDRKLCNGASLFTYTAALEVGGMTEIEVRERKDKRSKHVAKLEVRFSQIEIHRPVKCTDKQASQSVNLTVVDVKEIPETVTEGEEPIHWCLLTTHQISTLKDALQIVKWYCLRWNIEQLFRTLKKQGFQIESSQLETGAGLMKLAIIALRAAVQTMQLTLARNNGDRLATDVFIEEEIKVLNAIQPGLEGKTLAQKNPYSAGKLAWAAWIIARLGGWKGYASERPPGPITLLNGQKEFSSLCRGWFLAKNVCIP